MCCSIWFDLQRSRLKNKTLVSRKEFHRIITTKSYWRGKRTSTRNDLHFIQHHHQLHLTRRVSSYSWAEFWDFKSSICTNVTDFILLVLRQGIRDDLFICFCLRSGGTFSHTKCFLKNLSRHGFCYVFVHIWHLTRNKHRRRVNTHSENLARIASFYKIKRKKCIFLQQ